MEKYKDRINDYRINLLDVGRMENLADYQGELKALLGFVKYQKRNPELKKFVSQNRQLFSKISMETIQAMSILGNSAALKKIIQPNTERRETEMYADLNEALQEMMDEKWTEGRNNRALQVARNMYARGFSPEDAAALLEEPPETVRQWYGQWGAGEHTP